MMMMIMLMMVLVMVAMAMLFSSATRVDTVRVSRLLRRQRELGASACSATGAPACSVAMQRAL